MNFKWSRDVGDLNTTLAVLVCSLGWFVDIFDLILFSVVRVESLRALGLNSEEIIVQGALLLNVQMVGMLLGGLLWGIWGDKRGRIEILFGSILIYSVATIANSFVDNVGQYALCRFFAGLGLAGEIGASVTLIAELMPKHTRGLGTGFAGAIGALGGVFAGWLGTHFDWQSAYQIGGGMGLILLFMRARLADSTLFKQLAHERAITRGDARILLSPENRWRYLSCIGVGLPIFFVVSILMAFSPEISTALGISGVIAAQSITFGYLGLALGELLAAGLSQYFRSRKKVIFISLCMALLLSVCTLLLHESSSYNFYLMIFLLGTASGYWIIFNTAAAEQFGTNLRATVATTVPNIVRASTIVSTTLFVLLQKLIGILPSVALVGAVVFVVAFVSLRKLKESFNIDLDYIEADYSRDR